MYSIFEFALLSLKLSHLLFLPPQIVFAQGWCFWLFVLDLLLFVHEVSVPVEPAELGDLLGQPFLVVVD